MIPNATASVVVPAHNEQAVLGRCLDSLLRDADPDEFEVWVVVNGSSDRSADVARAVLASAPGGVLEIEPASKIAALRAGDAVATAGPRIYLDADVVLSSAAARALTSTLTRTPGPVAAAPRLRVDTSASSRVVRGWYRVWGALPSVRDGAVGSGVYGVNAAGRDRLGEFPDVINDDGWVRRSFAPGERRTVDAEFEVVAARTTRALISRRARIAVGNAELDRLGIAAPAWTFGHDTGAVGGAIGADEPAGFGAVRAAVRDGVASWPDVGCFLGVTAAARMLAQVRHLTGRGRTWSTDHTSREPGVQPPAGAQPPARTTPATVTALVVTYNARDWTRRCLTRLQDLSARTDGPQLDVVVFDNASSEYDAADLREWAGPSARIVASATNLGFAVGMNAAAQYSDAEYLLLVNPDAVLDEAAAGELVAFHRARAGVGIVGGRISRPDGSLDPASCWGEQTLWSLVCFATGLATVFPRHRWTNPEGLGGWDRRDAAEVGVVTGCLLLVDRPLWDRLDGFDEQFFMYGEDADLCHRARRLGATSWITPTAKAVHATGASSSSKAGKLILLFRGKATLVENLGGPRRRRLGGALLRAGVGIRSIGEIALRRRGTWHEVWNRRAEWQGGYR